MWLYIMKESWHSVFGKKMEHWRAFRNEREQCNIFSPIFSIPQSNLLHDNKSHRPLLQVCVGGRAPIHMYAKGVTYTVIWNLKGVAQTKSLLWNSENHEHFDCDSDRSIIVYWRITLKFRAWGKLKNSN